MERKAPPAAGVFLAKSGGNDGQRRQPPDLTAARTATRGEVYKSEGQSLFSLLRNSPPRLNVLHIGSNT